MKKKSGKPTTLLESAAAAKEAESESDVIAIGYFPTLEVTTSDPSPHALHALVNLQLL